MKYKYTRRQICEAISYWQKQLLNEGDDNNKSNKLLQPNEAKELFSKLDKDTSITDKGVAYKTGNIAVVKVTTDDDIGNVIKTIIPTNSGLKQKTNDEAKNTVKEAGEYIIKNVGRPEVWKVKKTTFEGMYKEIPNKKEGNFQIYSPDGPNAMTNFIYVPDSYYKEYGDGESIDIHNKWDWDSHITKGSYYLLQKVNDKDDIYGIEKQAFKDTYKIVQNNKLNESMYSRKQIMEAISYWNKQLNEMQNQELDEIEDLDEAGGIIDTIKNKVAGWLGIRSGWTDIENLIDARLDHDRESYRNIMKKIIKQVKLQSGEAKFTGKVRNGEQINKQELTNAVTAVVQKKIGGYEKYNKDKNRKNQYDNVIEQLVDQLYELFTDNGRHQRIEKERKENARRAEAKKLADQKKADAANKAEFARKMRNSGGNSTYSNTGDPAYYGDFDDGNIR